MDPEIQEIFNARRTELPPKLSAFAIDPKVASTIQTIADKYLLSEEKTLYLETLIMLVLLAFDTLEKFEERVVEDLYVPGSIAQGIAHDANAMLFSEIKGELEAIYKDREEYEKTLPLQSVSETSPIQSDSEATQTYEPSASAPAPQPTLADVPKYTDDEAHRLPAE